MWTLNSSKNYPQEFRTHMAKKCLLRDEKMKDLKQYNILTNSGSKSIGAPVWEVIVVYRKLKKKSKL